MSTKPKNYKRNASASAGFTLAELAVVLSIILFFIGLIVSTGQARIEAQRITLTKERMSFLMNSVLQYTVSLNHLPCPAEANLSSSAATFGVDLGSGIDNGSCSISNGNVVVATSNIAIGMVPVKVFGLTDDVAIDGWGNRFTYVVDQDLTFAGEIWNTTDTPPRGYIDNSGTTDPSTFSPPHSNPGTVGNIAIRNSAGTADFETEGAVMIISHGPNGFGAWKAKGGTRINPTGGSADEDENTDNDNVFVQRFRGGDFDDFILYKTKGQLLEK